MVKRLKNELIKLLSFAGTGVISAGIDCTVYYLLLNFAKINFRLIQPISMSVGLSCSFIINRGLVFKKEKSSMSIEVIKYLAVCTVSVLLSPIIISFYHIWFGEYIVKIPATLTTGLINYLLNRLYVYRNIGVIAMFAKHKNKKGNDKS